MKVCSKCEIEQSLSDFHKCKHSIDGYQSSCKSCRNTFAKNKYDPNKEKERKRLQYLKDPNKEKERTRYNQSKRMIVDPSFKLAKRLRSRLSNALKGNQKTGSAISDLGCTIKELKIHLESKFKLGMTWDNYGEWHIDHKKPLASFDLSNPQQFKEACNYKNLQPLWAEENLKKSDKYGNQ